jgi:hypothetical protein
MRTTPEQKNCHSCPDATNGKCPMVCQLSSFCPKDAAKPLAKLILKNEHQRRFVFGVRKN